MTQQKEEKLQQKRVSFFGELCYSNDTDPITQEVL